METVYPLWIYILSPVSWIVIMPYKFMMVSIALLVCARSYDLNRNVRFYKKNIGWSFVISVAGNLAATLLLYCTQPYFGEKWYEYMTSAVAYNPFDNVWSMLYVIAAVALTVFLSFCAYSKALFPKTIRDALLCRKVALIVAVFTAPYLYLVPTQYLYNPQDFHTFTNHAVWSAYTEAEDVSTGGVLGDETRVLLANAANRGVKTESDAAMLEVAGTDPDYTYVMTSETLKDDLTVTVWIEGRDRAVVCTGTKYYTATAADTEALYNALHGITVQED